MKKDLKKIDRLMDSALRRGRELFAGSINDAYSSRGKRIRAALVIGFAGQPDDTVLQTAAAVELLHAATLIHDDIIDNDGTRRGEVSMHVSNGISLGMLYGDYVLSAAFSTIVSSGRKDLLEELNHALSEIVRGEMLQESRRRDPAMSRSEYRTVIRKKTAELFGVSCRMGAILKGTSRKRTEYAYRSGVALGTSYQVLDDCRDYLCAPNGGSRLSDISNGVVTLPLIAFLEGCTEEEHRSVAMTLRRRSVPKPSAERIRDMIIRSGAMEKAITYAAGYMNKAVLYAGKYGMKGPVRIMQGLRGMVRNVKEEYCDSRRRLRGCQRTEVSATS